jgi:hypothetical protein
MNVMQAGSADGVTFRRPVAPADCMNCSKPGDFRSLKMRWRILSLSAVPRVDL